MNQIKLLFEKPLTLQAKAEIESELEILAGVQSIEIDCKSKSGQASYDGNVISEKQLQKALLDLGYETEFETANASPVISTAPAKPALNEVTYYIKGMHCASCELLIESQLLKLAGIKAVDASANNGAVVIEYANKKPQIDHLNQMFKKHGYTFSDQPIKSEATAGDNTLSKTLVTAGLIIAAFVLLNRLGLSSWVNINSSSSLPAFFFFGILAGLSSCAALVGGIILSMSKQWNDLYSTGQSSWQKLQPHLMFNGGRLLSYGVLGAVLGGIGSKLQISANFTATLVILISVLMVFLGLQMLGVKGLRRFQITMPKFITKNVADESKFKGRYMPAVMGALTFFLPCGFTITAQGLALISGNAWQGGLIMFLFALGTAPMLLGIGLSSIKFSSQPHLAARFLKTAGVVVLFFALFNINAQLNVLGLPSFSDAFAKAALSANGGSNSGAVDESSLPPIADGKQVVKMNASSSGYSPNSFKIRVGVPVRWEITDTGTSGCTNAIISQGLFSGQIPLTPGQTSIKEFTPSKVGRYKFSCWMGMISGVFEVVDPQNFNPTALNSGSAAAAPAPSGAKGCGCGGGGGSSCGAAPSTN